jgi:molybdate transport system substrate-binding protein
MLVTLGIKSPVSEHPNGAIAMKTMGASTGGAPLGCTQATEILYTPGVTFIGVLPLEFELSTLYSVAIPKRSANSAKAQDLVTRIVNTSTLGARQSAGFDC